MFVIIVVVILVGIVAFVVGFIAGAWAAFDFILGEDLPSPPAAELPTAVNQDELQEAA